MILFDPETGETLTPEMVKSRNQNNYRAYLADEVAIQALKEIQEYRKIGTVKKCKFLASIDSMVEKMELQKIIDEWLKYTKIGTIEKCQVAMDYWKYLRERRCGLDAVVEKCMQYEQIGTVEEFQAAMEEQKDLEKFLNKMEEAARKVEDIIRKYMPGKDVDAHQLEIAQNVDRRSSEKEDQ